MWIDYNFRVQSMHGKAVLPASSKNSAERPQLRCEVLHSTFFRFAKYPLWSPFLANTRGNDFAKPRDQDYIDPGWMDCQRNVLSDFHLGIRRFGGDKVESLLVGERSRNNSIRPSLYLVSTLFCILRSDWSPSLDWITFILTFLRYRK